MATLMPPALCRYYRTSSGCRYGDRCWFRHDDNASGSELNPGSTRMCRFFLSPTGCRFGNACHFRHISPEPADNNIQDLKETHTVTAFSGYVRVRELNEDVNNNIDKSVNDEVDDDVDVNDEGDDDADNEDNDDEIKTVVCGECKEEMTGRNIKKMLSRHYMSMFLAFDKPHTQFISQDWRFYREVMCFACFIHFDNSLSMLRHITDKAKLKKRDGPEHKEELNSIVHAFVQRDLGETEIFKDVLLGLLTEDDVEEEQAKFEPEDVEFFGRPLRQTSTLEKAKRELLGDDSDIERQAYQFSQLQFGISEEEMEERSQNCGFTEDEVQELLCQGVKPYDDDAWDVLAVLNGMH